MLKFLFFGLSTVLLFSCVQDPTYKEKYINLLESHVVELSEVDSDNLSTEKADELQVTHEEAKSQALEFYSFMCGTQDLLLDVRVSPKSRKEWFVLYKVESSSVNDFGLKDKYVFKLSVEVKDNRLLFDDKMLDLKLCD